MRWPGKGASRRNRDGMGWTAGRRVREAAGFLEVKSGQVGRAQERVQESVGHGTTSRGTYSRLSTSKLPLTTALSMCATLVRIYTSEGSYPFPGILPSVPAILRS